MDKNYPSPIYSTESGTWAHSTVSRRFPEIARRVLAENRFSQAVNGRITRLVEEIGSGSIRRLQDRDAPDFSSWESYIQPYLGKNWLEVPWFFAEHYFYRRIMEAVDYFSAGLDPFLYQKEQGLVKTQEDISAYAAFLIESWQDPGNRERALQDSLYFSLWGNQADLSLWPAGSSASPRHASRELLKDHLLADDSSLVIQDLAGGAEPAERVDLMLDNAGLELVSDLGLAELLLVLGFSSMVVLHVKAHPTFVSDVVPADIDWALAFLSASGDPSTSQLGKSLEELFSRGRILIRPDYFWNSPLPMWELPAGMRAELDQSALLISKGDANYRRLLGDRQWDFTTPFQEAVDYLPLPLAAVRTLKAELAVGLGLEQIQELFKRDPNWLVNGKWGLVHHSPAARPA